MNTVPLEQLRFESFGNLLKTKFRVCVDAAVSLDLELVEITPQRVPPAGSLDQPKYESFSLVFLGPADRLLPQQIYLFESPQIGRFELFIVPIGRDKNGLRYEATFNRLVKAN